MRLASCSSAADCNVDSSTWASKELRLSIYLAWAENNLRGLYRGLIYCLDAAMPLFVVWIQKKYTKRFAHKAGVPFWNSALWVSLLFATQSAVCFAGFCGARTWSKIEKGASLEVDGEPNSWQIDQTIARSSWPLGQPFSGR